LSFIIFFKELFKFGLVDKFFFGFWIWDLLFSGEKLNFILWLFIFVPDLDNFSVFLGHIKFMHIPIYFYFDISLNFFYKKIIYFLIFFIKLL
jgi:hypothetical protein